MTAQAGTTAALGEPRRRLGIAVQYALLAGPLLSMLDGMCRS